MIVAVFTGVVVLSAVVLAVVDVLARRRDRRRRVFVSKRCLRVFDPDPGRSST